MRGVLWVRVSTVDQASGYSPDAQLRALREAAAKRSIEIAREFIVSESAKTSETRRKFGELLDFIEEHELEYLVAYAVDRITRNPDDLHKIHNLIKGGLRVFIVDQNKVIDKDSEPHDKFIFMTFGNVAYLDNMIRGKRTKMSMLEKARQGKFPSRAPVGYLNIPDPADPTGRRRTVAVDPVKGPLVKLAFELYAKGGYSLATLRNELNLRGLHQKATAKNPNAPMSIYGLQVILGNPFYYGTIRWGGQTFEGSHEPLITAELFNRVQDRLTENRSYMRPAAKKYFPFKPFLKCGYCKSSITAEEQQGHSGKYRFVYYHCSYGAERKRAEPGRKCPLGYFSEERIAKMFGEALGKLYIDEAIADKIREQLRQSHATLQAEDNRERKRLQSEETRKKNHLDLLYQDRLDGTITKDQYRQKQTAFQEDLRRIKAELEKLERVNKKFREEGSTILDLLKGFKETYEAADPEGKAAILDALVYRARLYGKRRKKRVAGEDTIEDPQLYVIWKQPFDVLFVLGGGVREKREWRA